MMSSFESFISDRENNIDCVQHTNQPNQQKLLNYEPYLIIIIFKKIGNDTKTLSVPN